MKRFLRSIRLALLHSYRLSGRFQFDSVEMQVKRSHFLQATGRGAYKGGGRTLELGMARDLEVILFLANESIVGR